MFPHSRRSIPFPLNDVFCSETGTDRARVVVELCPEAGWFLVSWK